MGTVTYARHIYARAIASFEHCMMDSSVVSFIVHLLFNGDTGVHQHSIPIGHKTARHILAVIRLFVLIHERSLNSRLELGGVAVITTINRALSRQIIFAIWAPRLRFTVKRLWRNQLTAHGGAISQPLLFLIRQHIFPARCSCSRAPAHHPDCPKKEGGPHPREPPFPFRHSTTSQSSASMSVWEPSQGTKSPCAVHIMIHGSMVPASRASATGKVSGERGEVRRYSSSLTSHNHMPLPFHPARVTRFPHFMCSNAHPKEPIGTRASVEAFRFRKSMQFSRWCPCLSVNPYHSSFSTSSLSVGMSSPRDSYARPTVERWITRWHQPDRGR